MRACTARLARTNEMESGTVIPRPRRIPMRHRKWAPGVPSGAGTIVAAVALAALAGVVAGRGQWQLAVGLVAAPAFVVAALAAPERTTLALIATLPFFFYPATIGGFSLFLAVPTFGFVSIVLLMRRSATLGMLRRDLPVLAFAVLFTAAVVAAAASTDSTTAFSRVAYVALFGVFGFGLAAAIADGRLTRRAVAKAVLVAGGLAAIAILIQFVAQFAVGKNTVLDWLFDSRALFAGERAAEVRKSNWVITDLDLVRGIFPFMAPPAAGQFLMFSLISGLWLRREQKGARPAGAGLELVLLLLVAAALLCTFSRQSWLGAGIGVVALGLGRRPLGMLAVLVQLVLVVSLVPIPGSSSGSFGDYLLTAGDTSTDSTSTRLDLWGETIDLIPDHALIGAGPGLVGTLNPVQSDRPFYAHNIFLDSAVELGLVGALALLAMFLAGLTAAYRRRATLAFALLAAYVLAGLFDDVLYTPRNGLLLAVAFALIVGPKASPPVTRR